MFQIMNSAINANRLNQFTTIFLFFGLFDFRQIMEKGASQPWQEILQEVIGEGRLDGSALREYFRPLEEWLRQENLRNNEFVGWNYDGDYCKHRSVASLWTINKYNNYTN